MAWFTGTKDSGLDGLKTEILSKNIYLWCLFNHSLPFFSAWFHIVISYSFNCASYVNVLLFFLNKLYVSVLYYVSHCVGL